MDKLFFHSKSADKPAGKDVNECALDYNIYEDLNKIKDWRKILSNFFVAEFVYENKTYNSVEHAFQGKKIELVDKDKAFWFSKDSGHVIGTTKDGLVARKNRKLVILDDNQLNKWDKIKSKIMKDILFAKFTQVDVAKKVLLLTKKSELLHGSKGIPIMRQYELEEVRNQLSTIL